MPDVGGAHRGVRPIQDEVLGVLRKWFELLKVTDEELEGIDVEEREGPNIYRQMVDAVLNVLPNGPDGW